jgi:hypothetical protein
MQMQPSLATYTPITDAMDRHNYGITKNKKSASTGGGRAWSEEEVCFGALLKSSPETFRA